MTFKKPIPQSSMHKNLCIDTQKNCTFGFDDRKTDQNSIPLFYKNLVNIFKQHQKVKARVRVWL